MKLSLLPAAALAAAVIYALLRIRFGGEAGDELEAVVTWTAAFCVYFYAIYAGCALLGLAAPKRIHAACGGPFALLALLAFLGLFTGGSPGGWISINIGPAALWFVPGMPVWSLVSGSGAAIVERVPLAAMASRNIAVQFAAAVVHANGEILAALRCQSPQPRWFSRVSLLSPEGEPLREIAYLPYLHAASAQPDGRLRVVWQSDMRHQGGIIGPDNVLKEDAAPAPDEERDPPPPLTGVTLGDEQTPDRLMLGSVEIRTNPETGCIGAVHAEPDGAALVIFDVLGVHRFFYRREGVRPRVQRFLATGEPDRAFNENIRSVGESMDAIALLSRLPNGGFLFTAHRERGRARLYFVEPSGRVRLQRDY